MLAKLSCAAHAQLQLLVLGCYVTQYGARVIVPLPQFKGYFHIPNITQVITQKQKRSDKRSKRLKREYCQYLYTRRTYTNVHTNT